MAEGFPVFALVEAGKGLKITVGGWLRWIPARKKKRKEDKSQTPISYLIVTGAIASCQARRRRARSAARVARF